MSLGLYTQKNFAPSWSYTTIQIPLIRFTALAFIILQYFFYYNTDAQLHVLQQRPAAVTESESRAQTVFV